MKKNKLGPHQEQQQDNTFKIKKGLKIKLDCEFCKGPISLIQCFQVCKF